MQYILELERRIWNSRLCWVICPFLNSNEINQIELIKEKESTVSLLVMYLSANTVESFVQSEFSLKQFLMCMKCFPSLVPYNSPKKKNVAGPDNIHIFGRVIKQFLFQMHNELVHGRSLTQTLSKQEASEYVKGISFCKMTSKGYVYFLEGLPFTFSVLPWIKRARCTSYPIGSTSKKGCEGLSGMRAVETLGSDRCSRAESGAGAGKPP